MSSLQLGLIIAGFLLVIGVIVYNGWQERRLKRDDTRPPVAQSGPGPTRASERVEPTLAGQGPSDARMDSGAPAFRAAGDDASAFEPPLDVVPAPAMEATAETAASSAMRRRADSPEQDDALPVTASTLTPTRSAVGTRQAAMPDHEIECLIPLQPAVPVGAGALAAGLHARLGKSLRWFGRADARADWQQLTSDTPGSFADIVACLLLADRNGAASRAQIDAFVRIVGDIAPTLPAAFSPPDIAQELARAESLDRLCAELDVQIGLTVLKPTPGSIPGTRLRGVAEAAGFRLAPGGRFEYANEDTGAVMYTLQNLRPDSFTVESLRLTATNGVVFLLDVARIADSARAFDHMKLAAKRMATTLGAELVDDNHRPLDDAAFAAIREQIEGAVEALRAVHIEPGSARALALFSA